MFLIYFSDFSTEEQDNYFLLCDVLPEDRVLREELQKQKLVRIVLQNEECVGNVYRITVVIILFVVTFYFRNFQTYRKETIHQGLKTEKSMHLIED